MISSRPTLRSALAWAALAATALSPLAATAAQAQAAAAAAPAGEIKSSTGLDLYKLPPIPKYQPKKLPWGDPDFRGTWPIDSLGGLPMQRTPAQGNRVFLTDEEFATREKAMDRSRKAAETETKANKLGMGNWVEMTGAGRRTSLLIDPPNGRLPDLTEYGKKTSDAGRSSWVRGQTYDWIGDFDSWDRCVSRGFPASMLPFRYNNGIQIFQSPGYVVISLEMIHDARVIPIAKPGMRWPAAVTGWMGSSIGHWEGNTLVIETTNIRPGDAASPDWAKRAASPLNMATIGVPPNNTIPTSPQAKVVERMTMADNNTLVYEMTYSDPVVWTKPFSVRLDWSRNEDYGMFEYACFEGDVQFRNYISASRAERAKVIAAADEKKAADAKAAADAAAAAAAAADTGKKKKKG
jgi:hypothetical protein